MNRLILFAAVAAAVGFTGCKSIEVERHAQTLAMIRNADGTVSIVRDKDDNPIMLDGGWKVDYFQHWNWQRFDSLHATAGTGVALDINNYEGGANATNLTAIVSASFEGGTKLAMAIGEAYVKIAGGGAQAATVMDVMSKVYSSFSECGGDPAKATVKVDAAANTVTVSDGSVCTTCTADGSVYTTYTVDGTCTTIACSDK